MKTINNYNIKLKAKIKKTETITSSKSNKPFSDYRVTCTISNTRVERISRIAKRIRILEE